MSEKEKKAKNNDSKQAEEPVSQNEDVDALKKSASELNDKYIRLYADFENYKKFAAKNREDLLKYANEDLMTDLLTVIDHLELALLHSSDKNTSNALAEGVELTLKELKNVLEKYGLSCIDALGQPFDPSVHHAMSQIDTDNEEENTVIKEFRKGYRLKDKVLRATLVGVARRAIRSGGNAEESQSVSDEKD